MFPVSRNGNNTRITLIMQVSTILAACFETQQQEAIKEIRTRRNRYVTAFAGANDNRAGAVLKFIACVLRAIQGQERGCKRDDPCSCGRFDFYFESLARDVEFHFAIKSNNFLRGRGHVSC